MKLGDLLSRLPAVGGLALGLLGLLSWGRDGDLVSVPASVALLVSASFALSFKPRMRGYGLGALQACLVAICTYHIYGILVRQETDCRCLSILGQPNRLLVLALASSLLLMTVVLRSDQGISPTSGRFAHAAGVVAVILGIALGVFDFAGGGEDVEDSSDVPRERHEVIVAPLFAPSPRMAQQIDVADRESGWILRILGLGAASMPTVALPTGDWSQEAKAGQAGEWVVGGDGAPDFSTVYVEQDGLPTNRLAVEWQTSSGPLVKGTARSMPAGGRLLRGCVSDGLGQPVPMLRVLVADTTDLNLGMSLSQRRDAAELALRRFATATSDNLGRFAIENWSSEAAFCAPLDPGWTVIRPQLASLPGGAPRETIPPGTDIQLVVGRSIVVGVLLRLADGSEEGAVRFPVHLSRLTYVPPPRAIVRSPNLIGDVRADAPEPVRVLASAILLDSTQTTEEGWPAGTYVIEGPGFRRERVDLQWTSPAVGRWTAVTLAPSNVGPRSSLRTRLDMHLPAAFAGASVPVRVRAADGVETGDVMVVGSKTDELKLLGDLPSGNYEILTPLLVAPVRVSLPQHELPPVAVLRRETAALVVEVEAPSGVRRDDYGVLLRKQDDFPAVLTSATDLVSDAPLIALRRFDRGSALLFEVTKDLPLRLWLVAAGPSLRSESKELELRSGETVMVHLMLRRSP